MKRVVSSSFITLLIIVAVAATFFYLKNARNQGGDPLLAIPADAVCLISYDPASEKLGDLLSLECWKLLKAVPFLSKLEKQLTFFDTLLTENSTAGDFFGGQPLFLTGHLTGAGKFDFLFLKSLDNGFNEATTDEMVQSIIGSENEFVKRNYDGNFIREVNLKEGKIFSFVIAKGIFVASFTPFLVEDALRQLKLGKPVMKNKTLLEELNAGGKSSLCINFKNLPLFTGLMLEPEGTPGIANIKSYGDWGIATIEPQKNKLLLNGFLTRADSFQFVNCFNGQHPVEKKLIHILPRKTAAINYIGTDDFAAFYKKLSTQSFTAAQKDRKQQLLKSVSSNYKLKIEDRMLEWIGNEYALIVTEPAGMNYDNNSFAIFKAKNIAQAKKTLTAISRTIDKKNNTSTMEESYGGHGIGFIRLNGLLPAMFGAAFSKVTKMYYTEIEDYIVFANQAAAIRSFIDEYKSGLLLHKTDLFKNAYGSYPAKGNHFFFVRPGLASQIFKSMANAEWKKYTEEYKDLFSGISSMGFQVTAGDTLPGLTIAFDFLNSKTTQGIDLIFAVETDTTVSLKPLITTDPVAKIRQLLFQDDSLNLCLTNNSGDILWKQQLQGKIMGEIFEIDLFKNNTRQFLFNTVDSLFLVDSKGNSVGNFPIRLPAAATNGISVFDFDKNEDFKIYVACDNQTIYAYQPSGKPLPGWNFQSTIDVVRDPIRAIEINGKNILIIKDQLGAVVFVNRYGEPGIQIGTEFSQAENSRIFKTKAGSLITTDPKGSIVEIQSDGTIQTTALNAVSAEHGFLYADADADKNADYIFADGKELTAYNSQLVLIFRKEFDSPLNGAIQLLTLKNGEQVMGLRSDESNKLWLVKMDGTIYNGFPVKGSKWMVMDELNMDGNKHLITGGKEHVLYVYSIE